MANHTTNVDIMKKCLEDVLSLMLKHGKLSVLQHQTILKEINQFGMSNDPKKQSQMIENLINAFLLIHKNGEIPQNLLTGKSELIKLVAVINYINILENNPEATKQLKNVPTLDELIKTLFSKDINENEAKLTFKNLINALQQLTLKKMNGNGQLSEENIKISESLADQLTLKLKRSKQINDPLANENAASFAKSLSELLATFNHAMAFGSPEHGGSIPLPNQQGNYISAPDYVNFTVAPGAGYFNAERNTANPTVRVDKSLQGLASELDKGVDNFDYVAGEASHFNNKKIPNAPRLTPYNNQEGN